MNGADIWHSMKAVIAVAISSISAGLATILSLLPDVIGMIASIAGIILSYAFTRVHIARYKQIVLETEIARQKEIERMQGILCRKEHGEPLRREEDHLDEERHGFDTE